VVIPHNKVVILLKAIPHNKVAIPHKDIPHNKVAILLKDIPHKDTLLILLNKSKLRKPRRVSTDLLKETVSSSSKSWISSKP
jgi:hypothetical protein